MINLNKMSVFFMDQWNDFGWYCSIIFGEIFLNIEWFYSQRTIQSSARHGRNYDQISNVDMSDIITIMLLSKSLEFDVIELLINVWAIFFCLYVLVFLEILLKIDWLITIDWSFTGVHRRAENFIIN